MYDIKIKKGELCLYSQNELIGSFTYFYRNKERNLELNRLFVNFPYRNRGIATILIKEIINYAYSIGALIISVIIDPEPIDCYNTIAKLNGLEQKNYHSFTHLKEEQRNPLINEVKKLRIVRRIQKNYKFK